MTLDESFEKKDDISLSVQEKLINEMKAFGFQIHKQKRLRDAAVMAAEAEKTKVVKAAEAAADAAELQGQGIARQRRAIIDGLRDSITHGTEESLSTEKISELLLITQYFESLRDIAANSKAQTVFLPHSAGAVGDVAGQIRNGIMLAGAGQRM